MSNLPFMGKKSREGFFIACTKCSITATKIRRNRKRTIRKLLSRESTEHLYPKC